MGNWQEKWIDYYKILEINRNANSKQIKKSYRKLMHLYHPDVYKDNDGEEKAKLINEAYNVLSNSEEKEKYDLEYDRRLTQNQEESYDNNFYNQATDENINHYSYEEQKYAKKMALKAIIEEELEKASNYIETKNEIIFSAYNENIDKFEYYKNVKEFVSISNEYVANLYELCNLCYKYDFLSEIETINEVILFLEENINAIPLSPSEAIAFMEKENKKENLKQFGIQLKEKAEQSIQDVEFFFECLYSKKISHIEFFQFSENLLMNAQDIVSKGKELLLLLSKNELEHEDLESILGKLGAIIKTWPEDYQSALEVGKRLSNKKPLNDVLIQYENYNQKIKKIIKMIKRYPTNHRVGILYNYSKDLSGDMESLIKKALEYHSMNKNKEDIIDKAFSLSVEAEQIYCEANKQCQIADEIYNSAERSIYNDKIIKTLLEEAINQFDKGKSLELLKQSDYYLKVLEFINVLYDNDMDKIVSFLESKVNEIHMNSQFIENMIQVINKIISNYNSININSNIDIDEINRRMDELKTISGNINQVMDILVYSIVTGLISTAVVGPELGMVLAFMSSPVIAFLLEIKQNRINNFYDVRMTSEQIKQELKILKEQKYKYENSQIYYQKYLDLKGGKIL